MQERGKEGRELRLSPGEVASPGRIGRPRRRPASAPPRWMFRPLARALMFAYRHGAARMLGSAGMVLLTTVGRQTGLARTTPVVAFRDELDSWIIFGGYVALMDQLPGWYCNLVANPDKVWIQAGVRRLRVLVSEVSGVDRKAVLGRIHRIAEYQQATDRVVPILRLRPAPPA